MPLFLINKGVCVSGLVYAYRKDFSGREISLADLRGKRGEGMYERDSCLLSVLRCQ